MKIRLASILESNANGPGLRKVFFSQGCSHGCPDCFNKHTWEFKGGALLDVDEEVAKTVDASYLAGVTFSGGDPFDQPEPFAYLAKELKKHKINIWSYTGYTWEQLMRLSKTNVHIKTLLENIDVLVDGPFIKEMMDDSIEYRGSKNQRIINVQDSLKENKVLINKNFK